MGFTFDEQQKAKIKKYTSIKSTKAFKNFMDNMKDLLDPEKNTIMNQVLAGRGNAPESFSMLPPKSGNEEYVNIKPEDLIARVKHLIDAINSDVPGESAEFETEEARNKAAKATENLSLLLNTVQVFNDKYSEFIHIPELESKVYNNEIPVERYRAFQMGKSIIDEISKLNLDMDIEKQIDDEIIAQQSRLDDEKTKYIHNQKKLRHELLQLDSKGGSCYSIGQYRVNGKTVGPVRIYKSELRRNPLYYSDTNNPLDKIMKELDANVEYEKNEWLDTLHRESDRFADKADKVEHEYYRKAGEINEEYQSVQDKYDLLEEKLNKEQKFDEFEEYNQLQQAIDDAMNASTADVEDEYKRNIPAVNRGVWASDFDRDNVADYQEDLDRINQQISELEKTIGRENVWIESAEPAYESAKKAAELGSHVDAVIEEKIELINKQTADISTLVQDTGKRRIERISDIPQSAFSSATLTNIKESAEKQFLDYLAAQRSFTYALQKNVKFDKIVKDLSNIVDLNGKMKFFPEKNSVALGLDSSYIDGLKKAFTDNNPKDPDKTELIRRFGVIREMLNNYEVQLDTALTEKLEQYDARIAELDNEVTGREEQLQKNRDWIDYLKKNPEKLNNEYKKAVENNKTELDKKLKELKDTRDELIAQAKADYDIEIAAFKQNNSELTKKQIQGRYDFAVDRAKNNYARFTERAKLDAKAGADKLKQRLDKELADNKAELKERTERDEETNKIIKEYKQSVADRKSALLKEKDAAVKSYKDLHESVEKFRSGEYKQLGGFVDDALSNMVDYLNSVNEVYTENEKLRSTNISLLQSIPELEKQAAEKQKEDTQPSVTEEDLTKLEFEISRAKESRKSHMASLEYLKQMKSGLEKGRDWCAKKSKLKNLEDKQRFEDLKKQLEIRNNKLAELKANRDAQMNSLEKYRLERTKEAQDRYDNALKVLKEKKEIVQEAINDTAHAKRTLRSLKDGAKTIVEAKNAVSDGIRREQEVLRNHFTDQRINYDAMENRLMDAVMGSKKKYGFNSGLFRDIKDEITDYRKAKDELPAFDENNPLDPNELEAFRTRTEKLKAVLDAYIKDRFDKTKPNKKTKEGQLRLDAVMDLRRCIERQERDLKAYKDSIEALQQRHASINIKPESMLEFENLKMEDVLKQKQQDQPQQQGSKLAENFLDYGNIVSIEMDTILADQKTTDLEKSQPSEADPLLDNVQPFALPTEDEKEAFTQEDLELDNDEEHQKTADNLQIAFDAIKEAEKETEKLTKKYFKDEHDKSVVIPEVEYSGSIYLDLKNDIKKLPEEIRAAVLEFDETIRKIPVDYGFEKYNKNRWFFNKISLDQYKQDEMAIAMFMADNNLVNPVPSPEDLSRIKAFDKEMAKIVNADTLGYKEYFNAELEKNADKDPMTQEEFLMNKFNLKDHLAVVNFLIEKRREAGAKQGKIDPRTTIKNYGSFVKGDEFLANEIKNKLAEAQKASQKRNTIIKEIADYDKQMSKVKPSYGFKSYIKAKNPLPLDEYIRIGAGSLRYAMQHKLVSPKLKYKDYKGEWTPEMNKELADYQNLMKKNRTFEYKQAYNEIEATERKQYEASGMAKLAYIKDHPKLIDPRVKYDMDIRADGILLQMYMPRSVEDLSEGNYYNMNQLSENDLPEDYEKHALEIIARDRKYKEAAKELASNPLLGKQSFEGNYYEGFEKYPDDLKEKIREFDMIMATVPDDYAYESFEKNVDFCHRFSKEEYISKGFGKQYFCQLHQMVDPRVPLDLAKKIRDYDILVGPTDGKAHKAWEDYKKQNPKENISFEDYKHRIYGDENLKLDTLKARDNYEIESKETDPRPEFYGRIVLNKEEFKKVRKPIFDDSERIARNEQIVEEMKAFVQEIRKAPADYGFEKYEKGQNIEKYVTLREYKLTDEPLRKYIIDNGLVNPLNKYSKYVSVDAELRRQINAATKEYREEIKDRNEQIAAEKETDPLFAKREAERAKTKALLDKLDKDFRDQGEAFYKQNLASVNKRRSLRALQEGLININEDISAEEKLVQNITKNIDSNLLSSRDLLGTENYNAHIEQLYVQRYCDQLTIDDIEREEEAFGKFDELLEGQTGIFGNQTFVPISKSEKIAFGKRQARVNELKQLKSVLDEMEKKTPKVVADIKKDPERLNDLMEKIRSKNKAGSKQAEKQNQQSGPEKQKADSGIEKAQPDNPVLH